MKTIPLTRGQVAIVDDEDYEELAKFKWYAHWVERSQTYYACRDVHRGGRKCFRMHREIAGAAAGQEVDHINHNGLDNRRENLRLCTRRQNMCNTRKRSGCSSRYKGVSLCKESGTWHSYINVRGKRLQLGWFARETDAARAYNRAAAEHFGEFAALNDIPAEAA